MIEQVHVQVAIVVVVKKCRLGRKAHKVESIGCSRFCKSQVAIVDKELVGSFCSFVIAHLAQVDVLKAICIYIGHRHSCGPGTGSGHTGLGGDVFKLKIALVSVELVRLLIGYKIEVNEPIIVKIGSGHARPIVKVEVF